MSMLKTLVMTLAIAAGLSGCVFEPDHKAAIDTAGMSKLERVGMELFFDESLSTPSGQACASCHLPTAGFADPDDHHPTSEGVHPGRFGSRNAPIVSYAKFSPPFHFDKREGLYVGGQFWDGRASTLEEQAKQPFLNPVEMANPGPHVVAGKVREAWYAEEIRELFGDEVFNDDLKLYDAIASAIAAFERTDAVSPFTSKYDYFLAGKVDLTPEEKRGLELFEREDKGNCAACHPSQPGDDGSKPLFTDFTYDNLGVPSNPENPHLRNEPQFNPHGDAFVDLGLGGKTGVDKQSEHGKFKVPTLRNIADSAPYMHNGVLLTLRQVVDFYNSRDTEPARWGSPEVAENVNSDELGNLGLNDEEIDAIVAFMETLTDGYKP
jgi:cytochrome c peroxidase